MIVMDMVSELIKSVMKPRESETGQQRAARIMLLVWAVVVTAALMVVANRAIILSTDYVELKHKYDALVEAQSKNQHNASFDRGNGNGLVPGGFWDTTKSVGQTD